MSRIKKRSNKSVWRLAEFLFQEIGYVSSDYDVWKDVSPGGQCWWYDMAKKVYHMIGYNE